MPSLFIPAPNSSGMSWTGDNIGSITTVQDEENHTTQVTFTGFSGDNLAINNDLFPYLTYIFINGSDSLYTLVQIPDSVTRLQISGLTGDSFSFNIPSTLQWLDLETCNCSFNVTALPEGLQKLTLFGCGAITTIPALPSTLQWLSVAQTPLTEIPTLPDGLTLLDVSSTALTACPDLPDTLQILKANGIDMEVLHPDDYSDLTSLLELQLSNCNLSQVPVCPETLQTLDVSSNPTGDATAFLAAFPPALTTAYFNGCGLTQADTDAILVSLDTGLLSDGTVILTGNSTPSITGLAAKTSLEGKGWTVSVDP